MSELKVNKVTPRSGTTVTIGDSGEHLALAGNIGLGGATPTTSGTGITFPATASASTDANTLDDYEEGTWTPLGEGTTGTVGSYAQTTFGGKYTKIGNLVYVIGSFSVTNLGSYTGEFRISGLPFTVNDASNNTASRGSVRMQEVNYDSGGYITAETNNNTATFRCQTTVTGIGNNPVNFSELTTSSFISFSLTYFTT